MALINGTPATDNISGTSKADEIYGLAGDDTVRAAAGDDRIFGGVGNDELWGGEGSDSVVGDQGNDRLFGDGGGDNLSGGDGDDALDGGAGTDNLSGGDGRDTLTGGSGSDELDGAGGVDIARFSGKQSDYRIATKPNGTMTITDQRPGASSDGVDTLANIERLYFAGDNTTVYLTPNTPPVAADDVGSALENSGTPSTGNVLGNDSDGDLDPLNVSAVRTGTEAGSGTAGTVGAALAGAYGSLTLNADGSYSYVVDNANATVNALNATQSLTDNFTYAVSDGNGGTDQATLAITITGANDAPTAADDAGSATEAGTAAGSDASGNVLTNDSDVDNGDTKSVATVRTGTEAGSGTAGTVGAALAGAYGSLTLNADGSYSYLVDNDNATVNALNATQSLTDNFTYAVSDGNGGTDQATLAITITGANDAPTATDDAGSATEAGVAAGSDANGNVLTNDSDVDSGDSKSVAAVRTGTEAGSGTAGTVGAALAGAYGSLTMNADGSYSYAVDNANATVNALNATQSLTDNFTYAVSDGNGGTDQATLAITITGANDAPTAADDAGSATEAGTAAGSDANGNVLTNDSDVDSGDTKSVATVRTGTEAGSGTAGTVGAALAGAYGSLTLNADGSYSYLVDKDNATVNALNATQSLTDNFTYAVSDGNGGTDQATLAITITGANDAPTATDDAGSATEAGVAAGSDANGNVLTNDSDVDNGDTKSVATVRTGTEAGSGTAGTVGAALAGAYGSLTVNADGSYSYLVDNANATVDALNATQSLTDNFTYAVSDGNGGSDQATLAITINGANDAPTAADDAGSATEAGTAAGSDASGNVLTNDSDVDSGDTKSVATVRTGTEAGSGTAGTIGAALAGAYGSLTMNADGSYSYAIDNANATVNALNATQSLTDNFTYAVSDGNGGTDQATLAITITGANDAPTAADDAGSATEAGTAAGSNASGNVLTNDSDVDSGDTKSVSAVRTGAEAGSGTAGTVGAALAGAYGSLTMNADGSYSYAVDNANATVNALNSTQSLTDNFTYAVSDGNGGTDQATLAITITGANDAPVATDDAGSATEAGVAAGSDASGNVLTNDSDVDSGDTKSVATVRTGTEAGSGTAGTVGAALAGAYGSLTVNADGSYSYLVDNDNATVNALNATQSLTDNFTYAVSDGNGGTDQATLAITITGANDAPVATDDAGSATEAGVAAGSDASGNVLTNDSDVDSGDTKSVATVRTGTEAGSGTAGTIGAALAGAYGSLTVNADGSYSYAVDNDNATVNALNATQSLTDNFTYAVSDGNGGSDQATLTITITGANDAPASGGAQSVSGSEDDASIGSTVPPATDVDGDSLTYALVTGSVEIDNVTATDDAVTFNANGSYSYTPGADDQALNNGESRSVTFEYVASDGTSQSAPATVTITVNGADDNLRPAAGDDSATTDEDTAVVIDVLANDSDPEGEALTPQLVTAPTNGAVSYDASTKTFTYTPAADFSGTDGFTYEVSDTAGGVSSPATVAITVNPINDRPVISSGTQAATVNELADGAAGEDATLNQRSGIITYTDRDASQTHTASFTPQGTGYVGTFSLGAVNDATDRVEWSFEVNDSALNYLAANQTLTQNYLVLVTDSAGASASQTVTITLRGANDPVTNLALSGQTAPENVPGAVVGVLSATDPDTADTLTYSILPGADGARFTIVGNELRVGSTALDYETAATHTVNVRVTDGGGASTDTAFKIAVQDSTEGALTQGTDTISPQVSDDQVSGNSLTLNPGDSLDGGGGNDSLLLFGSGTFDLRPAGVAQFTGFEEVRLVNFTANEAGLILRGTADPLTIRGSGSGRETIWLNTAAAATVDVQTADGGDLVYGGAGTAVISTGKGGDQVSLSSGAATVNSGDDGDVIYLGTGQATVNTGAGNDTVYTHLSNSVYINNVYYGANTTGGWNAGNSLDGGANFDTLSFYGSGTFDLTANSIVNFEQLYLGASSLTLIVDNDLLSTVTSIGSNYASNRLAVTDASVNLSNKSVSNLTITSNNATGTTFTVNNTQTAFQIFGGSGGADVLNAPTLTLTSDQRGIIFATSSIESIVDSTGSYSAPAPDPAVFKLTSSSDTVPPAGVTPPDSITVNASSVTLTSGDSLDGGATGTDVLALYGSGTFDLRSSGVAQLTGFEEVRLVNFTASEAGLILRGTADPLTIRGSGSGRETIWLNTAAAATVDVQTADGGDLVYGGAGTAVISTGKGGDQVSLSSGAATVNSGDDGDIIRLGTGQATVNTGAGNDTVYTHLSNSVYINNVYYGANTTGGWNAGNSLDGGANFDALQFYGSGTFDLTGNSIVNFESLYLGASSLTLIVDNDLLSTVTSIGSNYASNRLAVTDASVNLSNKSVSNLTITSNNATGTTFTVNSTQTAFQIFGGSGGADVLNAPTLTLTSDQRGIIFATSSIESIVDSTGSYSAPAADPAVFKLTSGSDTVPPAGVTPPDSITVNASTVTLTSGDSLDGGATGTDVLALYGGGTFDLRSSGVAQLTGFEEVRLVNFTASEAGLILRGTADPLTIRGSGSGRETIWLNTAAAATVDVQTADGGDLVYGGAGTAVISTGKGGDQVSLSSGAATVNSGDDGDVIFLGTGQATVNTGAGNDTVYTHQSNNIFINNLYYGGTTGGWNAGNSLDGGASFDTLQFSASGTFDLTANSIVNFEQLYLAAPSLTLIVDNDLLSTVTSIASTAGSNRLAVTDASVNLSSKSVSNLTITSNNASGTTFTVSSTQTAFQIIGGNGVDTIQASFAFTAEQRAAIFSGSLVEVIRDTTGSYGNAAANDIQALASGGNLDGGAGNDILRSGSGNDAITGGSGADTIVFAVPSSGTDSIIDYVSGTDKIQVSASGFGLSAGDAVVLSSGSEPASSGAGAQFLYDTDDGRLSFDSDGSGAAQPVVMATLVGQPTLLSSDILVA